MGCNLSLKAKYKEYIEVARNITTDLNSMRLIGFYVSLDNRIKYRNSMNLKPISCYLTNFLCHRKMNSMNVSVEIIIKLIDAIHKILTIRNDHGMKFYMAEFDEFYYDTNTHTIVTNDLNILKDYKGKLINDGHFKIFLKRNIYSLQPVFYDKEINEEYKKLFSSVNFSYMKYVKFYTTLFIKFLIRTFSKYYTCNNETIDKSYNKFQKDVLLKLNLIPYDITLVELANRLREIFSVEVVLDSNWNNITESTYDWTDKIRSEEKITHRPSHRLLMN